MPAELSEIKISEIKEIIGDFYTNFALNDDELTQTDIAEHKILLNSDQPIKIPTRPVPFALREKVMEMIRNYLERGVIRPSESPYSSPVVLAKKKDGSLRFCVDFCRLNAITKKDAYPVPDVDTTLLSLGKKRFFSSLDMLSGYWQIKMQPECIEKQPFPLCMGTMNGWSCRLGLPTHQPLLSG